MGASTWVYFTPYHPQPAVALRRLRKDVFASGQYRRSPGATETIAKARALPSAADTHRQSAAAMRAAADAIRRNPEAVDSPLTRQQLLAFFQEAGMTAPAGTPAEQLIAFYEQQALCSEQMAAAAEDIQPSYLRFLDAVEADSPDRLPNGEREDFHLFQQLSALSPTSSRKFRRSDAPPNSIEALLNQAGEDGTHSILDIARVGRRATHATAFPIRPDLLIREFGTTEPTREQVAASELAFAEELTWCAVYFAVFQDGQPTEWAFVGSSGD